MTTVHWYRGGNYPRSDLHPTRGYYRPRVGVRVCLARVCGWWLVVVARSLGRGLAYLFMLK